MYHFLALRNTGASEKGDVFLIGENLHRRGEGEAEQEVGLFVNVAEFFDKIFPVEIGFRVGLINPVPGKITDGDIRNFGALCGKQWNGRNVGDDEANFFGFEEASFVGTQYFVAGVEGFKFFQGLEKVDLDGVFLDEADIERAAPEREVVASGEAAVEKVARQIRRHNYGLVGREPMERAKHIARARSVSVSVRGYVVGDGSFHLKTLTANERQFTRIYGKGVWQNHFGQNHKKETVMVLNDFALNDFAVFH